VARLNIQWTTLADASVTTGVAAAEIADTSSIRGILKPEDRQHERPILVYLSSKSDAVQVEQDVIEKTTLMDERVQLAAKLFTMVKADGDAIDETHPYARLVGGRSLPRFVLYSASGERIGQYEGSASPGKLFALMKRAAERDYTLNVDDFVQDYQKILTALDKLQALTSALESKESRDETAKGKREIEKKRAQYEAEQEELKIAEEKLLQFERRVA
jgi:hypothetical protein